MNKLEDLIVPPLAVVCHDAGSANVIIAWLKSYTGDFRACMEGPARNTWKKNFPDSEIFSNEDVMKDAKTLLSGTGSAELEHFSRIDAKKKSIKTIAVIDHWTDYKGRFTRDDNETLPDIIIVTDEYAYEMARDCFSSSSVIQVPNNYLQKEVELAQSLRTKECREVIENILVIGSPERDKLLRPNYLEFSAIEFLMSNLNKINLSKHLINISLRLHPAEPLDKYDFMQNKYQHLVTEIKISKNNELYEDIAWADLVVGLSSYALVVSLACDVPTMSILPPGPNPFALPFKKIIQLRD